MKTTTKPEVTKDWLAEKIKQDPARVIGRALLAIYKRQTFSEQATTSTKIQNGIGFSKPDARVGTIGARMYQAHAKLQDWVVDVWSKPAKDGYPRICKYVGQLDEVAKEKHRHVESRTGKQLNIVML